MNTKQMAVRLQVLLRAAVVWIAVVPGVLAAAPSDLSSAGYEVLSADINGDGCTDYLVRGKPRVVILDLDDDFLVPIQVPSRSPASLLLSTAGCQYAQSVVPSPAQLSDPRWLPAPYSVMVGDVLGAGNGSLLVVPTTASNPVTFDLARTAAGGEFVLVQTLSLTNLYATPGRSAYLETVDQMRGPIW